MLPPASVGGAVTGMINEGQLQGNREGFSEDVGAGVVGGLGRGVQGQKTDPTPQPALALPHHLSLPGGGLHGALRSCSAYIKAVSENLDLICLFICLSVGLCSALTWNHTCS